MFLLNLLFSYITTDHLMAREGFDNTCIQMQHNYEKFSYYYFSSLEQKAFGQLGSGEYIAFFGRGIIYDHWRSFIDKRKSFHCFFPVWFLCTQNMLLKFNCEMSIKGILFLHSKVVHNTECLKFRKHIKLFCPCGAHCDGTWHMRLLYITFKCVLN